MVVSRSAGGRAGVRRVLENASYLVFSNSLGAVLRAVYALVIARFLGPELYGLYNYGMGWYLAFIPLANLSMESVMARRIGVSPDSVRSVLAQTILLRSSSVIVATLACLLIGWLVEDDSGVLLLLIVFSFAVIGRSLATWVASVFVAIEKVRRNFILESSMRMLEICVGIGLILAGYGILALAVMHVASWWIQAMLGMLMVRWSVGRLSFQGSLKAAGGLLIEVLPIAVSYMGIFWLLQGPIILFRLVGNSSSDLGQVALVLQIFFITGTLPISLGRAALPLLSRSVSRKDTKDALFLSLSLRASLFGGTIIGLVSMALGDALVPLVFGDQYEVAGSLLGVAIWLVIPFSMGWIVYQLLIAHRKKAALLFSSLLGALAMTGTIVFLVEVGDTVGFLTAVGFGMSVWSILALVFLSEQVEVDWWLAVGAPVLSVIPALGGYWVMTNVTAIWSLSLTVALGLLLGVPILLKAYLQEEKVLVLKLVRGFGSRRVG